MPHQPPPSRAAVPASTAATSRVPDHVPVLTYGSDVMAALIRALGIPYVACNPGASFRGLHESLLNLPPEPIPPLVECTHEEIAVAIAHGYAKATGTLMAAALHNVVGLQHASMAIYNAWCDRVPVLLLGGTGPMDVGTRRPRTDWLHTALVQGNLIRDFVKWDDQPASLASLADSLYRAYRLSITEPAGPVYVCFDAALQEQPLPASVDRAALVPDPTPYQAASSPAADPAAIAYLAAALRRAHRPVLLADHVGRSPAGFETLGRLADAWAFPVLDLGGRLNLPTTHTMNLTGDEDALLAAADLVLALDVRDVHGALATVDRVARTTTARVPASVRIFTMGLGDYGVRALTADYQRLAPAERHILADTALALPQLLDALGTPATRMLHQATVARRREIAVRHAALRAEWSTRARASQDGAPVAVAALAEALRTLLAGVPFVIANGDLGGWVRRLFALERPRQWLGSSGGGGLGYGIGATIGACLAHRHTETVVVDIQSDGDLLFTPGGLWTLAHERLPALIVMHNNGSYYNSEEHQRTVAQHRARDEERAVTGTRIEDPPVDFARLAESLGVTGFGPIRTVAGLGPALRAALAIVREERRPALVDVVTQARN